MNTREKAIEKLIFICAAVSVAAVALITIFIFAQGMPAIQRVGLFRFIFGTTWSPTNGSYGILPLIAGSMAVTLGALIIGIPTGLGCAVFLSEVVTKRQAGFFRSAIELLAGIPSVVYGFFGLAVIVPMTLRKPSVRYSSLLWLNIWSASRIMRQISAKKQFLCWKGKN